MGTQRKQRRSPDGSVSSVTPTVRHLEEYAVLNQTGGIPGVLTFDHTWTLEAVEGGTRVVQYEEYRGIGVLFWNPGWVEAAYRRGDLFDKRRRLMHDWAAFCETIPGDAAVVPIRAGGDR